jgi:nitroreductase
VFQEGARRGAAKPAHVPESLHDALNFLSRLRMDVWVNRQVMVAVTMMMLVAESFGFDTAPIEEFDAAAVKREFGIPDEGEVVALLAIGHGKPPDKPYTGRFSLERIVFNERFGAPWQSS